LRRQVLARHEEVAAIGFRVPHPAAREVDDRLVEALAVLRRDAAVAERSRSRECVELAVGLVDDHGPQPRERRDAARECDLALDRLLDEERRRAQLVQPRLGLDRRPQLEGGFDVVVLLVAVDRDVQALDAVEHARDPEQPVEVGADVTRDLELEAALAVACDDLLERLRQAVVDPRPRRLVGGGDGVDEADGVARLDRRHRLEAGEKGVEVERAEIGDRRMRSHARQVAAHRGPEADAEQAADRVEHRTVEQCVAEARDERRQLGAAAGTQLVAVVVGEEVERGRRRRLAVRVGGDLDRLAQLVLVLGVAQLRVLVEPLRGEHLGGVAEALAAVVEAKVDANERLPPFGERDDAEAKRHAQAKRLLERLDAEHLHPGRVRGDGRAVGHAPILQSKTARAAPPGDQRMREKRSRARSPWR
jgi:hypothetical protein